MPFRKMQWLFPLAVTLHNAEEATFMPRWMARRGRDLPLHPQASTIWFGLMLLTTAAIVLTSMSVRKRGRQSVWAYLFFGYVTAMLANVLLPHLVATLVFREYTPGTVTAVFINLPVMIILITGAVRERWVSGKKAVAYALLVPLALTGAIAALFLMTSPAS